MKKTSKSTYNIFSIGAIYTPHQCQEILKNGWMST